MIRRGGLFTILSGGTTFDDRIGILGAQIMKPLKLYTPDNKSLRASSEIDECITAFFQRLQIPVECCECREFTM